MNQKTEGEPLRVAFYIRRSLDDDDHQKFSREAQADRLEAHARGQYERWLLVDKYVDSASGTTLDRPELQRLLGDARAGLIDVVLVYRVDRLSRNVRHLSGLVEDLNQIGVVLKSASEPFDTSAIAGRMMLQMLGVFAEFEHATIIERTKTGMRKKARLGQWCGGQIPFGYRLEPERGLVPDATEAPVVEEIFRLYTVERLGGVNVSRELNRRGFRTRAGKKWNSKAVLDLLRRAIYAGLIHWGGVQQEGIHEALVDMKTWQTAQDILKARGEDLTARLSNRSERLLTGVVYCARCGSRMTGVSGWKDGRKHTYYACRRRYASGVEDCGQEYLPAPPLEEAVVGRIREIIADESVFKKVVKAAQERAHGAEPATGAELKAVESRITKARDKLDRYFQAFEQGNLDAAGCGDRVRALQAELRDLETEREAVNRRAVATHLEPAGDVSDFLARFDAAMREGAPPSKKKHLVKILVPRVEVASRSQIDVFFRAPPSLVRLKGCLAPQEGLEPPA